MKTILTVAMLALTACSTVVTETPLAPRAAAALRTIASTTQTPIQHVIFMVQENRSFDNLFATFPGADGTTTANITAGPVIGSDVETVPLKRLPLTWTSQDLGHGYHDFLNEYDNGKMDGWIEWSGSDTPPSYVDPKDIAPYWFLAKRYVLADHFFATEKSSSFAAHQDVIAGSAAVTPFSTWVDSPTGVPWGCTAAKGTVTSVLTSKLIYKLGPYPCHERRTLADLLNEKGLSWKYYVESWGSGNIWNGFNVIPSVRCASFVPARQRCDGFGADWSHVSSPETNVLSDIAAGALPAFSWVIPDGYDSDHPGVVVTSQGPQWIAEVVNAVGQSKYWRSTAIVIVWDDWGGFYDHVPPPQLDYKGLGFRVPCIIVSPYARAGYVAHTQYEFGSILKFAEDNWRLGRLGTTDVRANSIIDAFDFTQRARRFRPVPAKSPVPPRNRSIPEGD